jgi:hypothetical protein
MERERVPLHKAVNILSRDPHKLRELAMTHKIHAHRRGGCRERLIKFYMDELITDLDRAERITFF